MAIDIGINCNDCFGDMELSDPPILGDFNDQGSQDAFCDTCGNGFKNEIMKSERTASSTFTEVLSEKKLLHLHGKICKLIGRPYLHGYAEKQEFCQMIRDTCHTRKDLIDYYVDSYKVDPDFWEENLFLFGKKTVKNRKSLG